MRPLPPIYAKEFNENPYDDYTSNTSKFPHERRKFHKDEHVLLTSHRLNREAAIQRKYGQHQILDGSTARQVIPEAAIVTFGRYNWKGCWYAITQGDEEQWVDGREVRGVPSRSLAEVERRGGRVTDKERAMILAGAALEDPNAPVLQPNLAPVTAMTEGQGEVDEAEARPSTRVAGQGGRISHYRKKQKSNDRDEWVPGGRGQPTAHYRGEDIIEEGSDIEVAAPSLLQRSTKRRGGDSEFPDGLH